MSLRIKFIETTYDEMEELQKSIEESNDMLLSCAEQFLMTDDHGVITHSYMSTEEALCAMLVKRGILEQISRGKFRVIAESNPSDQRAGLPGSAESKP